MGRRRWSRCLNLTPLSLFSLSLFLSLFVSFSLSLFLSRFRPSSPKRLGTPISTRPAMIPLSIATTMSAKQSVRVELTMLSAPGTGTLRFYVQLIILRFPPEVLFDSDDSYYSIQCEGVG